MAGRTGERKSRKETGVAGDRLGNGEGLEALPRER